MATARKPNFLQRMIVKAALKTVTRHNVRMGYDAASQRRRLSKWQPTNESPAAIVAGDGRVLRDRARDLVRNNPYASSACESFVANLIGAGITPSPIIADRALRKKISQAWTDWTDECDADGLADYYGMQALAARAMFEAGECFLRLRSRRADDGLTVPLQLQLLEADMCPIELNQSSLGGLNRIINGIEFDAIGNRVAYYFWRRHPGDVKFGTQSAMPVRVPADQVVHIFRPLRPGQVRGIPWVAPAMLKLWLLDQYDDAELDRKKVAAMFAGFIESPESVFEDDDTATDPQGNPLDADVPGVTLEPATIQQLLPGEKITWATPADVGGSYEMFQYRNLLAIASSLGVPYAAMTGDLKKANYSSSRGGLLEARRRLEQVQHGVMVYQACRPVRARWMDDAVICGALDLPGYASDKLKYSRARWITPRSEWADPYKDGNAELLNVRAGFKPLSDVVEAGGQDFIEAMERARDDAAILKEFGLVLDSDPSQVSRAGLTQARPAGSVIPDPGLEASDVIDTSGDGGQNTQQDDAADAA